MQYKQVPRMLEEILRDRKLPEKIRLKVIDLIPRDNWPRIGPFRKESPGQALWRISSNSKNSAIERWQALEKLLEIVKTQRPRSPLLDLT